MRSTYGALKVDARRLADTYDDLEPCYEKAEWEIGVSGDDGENRPPPREKPLPMPPVPHNRESARPGCGGAAGLAASVRHPDAAQLGAVQRSPGVHACRWCVGFACEWTPSAARRTR